MSIPPVRNASAQIVRHNSGKFRDFPGRFGYACLTHVREHSGNVREISGEKKNSGNVREMSGNTFSTTGGIPGISGNFRTFRDISGQKGCFGTFRDLSGTLVLYNSGVVPGTFGNTFLSAQFCFKLHDSDFSAPRHWGRDWGEILEAGWEKKRGDSEKSSRRIRGGFEQMRRGNLGGKTRRV